MQHKTTGCFTISNISRWTLSTCLVALLSVSVQVAGAQENSTDEETLTISKIMKLTHKKPNDGGAMLLKKVAIGRATTKEKQTLLTHYQTLAKLKPAKGDLTEWQAKTKLLVDAAEAAVKGHVGADKQLQRAANCTACHNEHKGT